jgi:hypothetical protein
MNAEGAEGEGEERGGEEGRGRREYERTSQRAELQSRVFPLARLARPVSATSPPQRKERRHDENNAALG